MNDDGKLDQLLNEMIRFKIDILGASETHWTADTQEAFEHQNFVILQAGRNDGLHRQGVALIIKVQQRYFKLIPWQQLQQWNIRRILWPPTR